MGPHESRPGRGARAFLLVYAAMAAGIIAAGFFYFLAYQSRYRREVVNLISSVAAIKRDELARWRRERFADAGIMYRNPAFVSLARRCLADPPDAEACRDIEAWFRNIHSNLNYSRVCLHDASGAERVSVPPGAAGHSAEFARCAREAAASGMVSFEEFHRNEHDGGIYLSLVVPVCGEEESGRPIGFIGTRIDPRESLYPLIARWPIPTRSAEIFIVRKDGDGALCVSDPRNRRGAALSLRFPAAGGRATHPAAMAVTGATGVVEGRDDRGTAVIADVGPVPDSPWFLVARMDRAEVFAPIRRQAWITAGAVLALLVGAGALAALLWRRQDTRFFKEQYETARVLRDSEAKYRTLFEGSADGIYLMTDIFTDCNEQACRLWKCRREDIVGHSPVEFSPPVQPDGRPSLVAAKEHIDRALAGEPQYFYWKHKARDGTLMDCEVSLKALEISGKRILQATVRDISARTKAKEEAKLSQQLIHYLSKYANDFIILLNDTFRFVEVNDRTVDRYGYSRGELIGMHAAQLRAPGAQRDFADQIKAAKASGAVLFETVHRRKDGSTFPVEINLHAIDVDGRKYYQAVIRDISARREAERLLGEANRALKARSKCSRALIRATDEATLLKEVCRIVVQDCGYRMAWVGYADPAPEKAVRPVAWSGVEDGFLDTLRFTWGDDEHGGGLVGAAIRTGAFEISRDTASDPRFAPWREATKRRGYASAIALPLIEDGVAFAALVIYASEPDSFRGEEVELLSELSADLAFGIAALRARAERRRAQRELEAYRDRLEEMVKERTAQLADANRRLETVNRELEAFSYSASHDLRAPLRSMEGFGQALLEDYGGTLEDKAKDYLGRIIASSRHMAELIDDLLNLSRVSRSEMRLVETDLSAIAKALLSNRARQEPERSVECVVAPGATARCDPRLLTIVLENLIGNAWKFTAKTPKARIEFSSAPEDGRTVFCVRDNGAGFEMEYANKLFKPFQRLHAGRDFPGTGIGLAIVQRIISRHGGTVRAEGKPGGGATFCFTL